MRGTTTSAVRNRTALTKTTILARIFIWFSPIQKLWNERVLPRDESGLVVEL